MLTTHRSRDDDTPLQLISLDRLAYYQMIEAELLALKLGKGDESVETSAAHAA